jgi:hypothetical protein
LANNYDTGKPLRDFSSSFWEYRKTLWSFRAFVLVGALIAAPALAQVAHADAAGMRLLQAWLDAFNSGERAQIQAFVDQHGWPWPMDDIVAFRNQTGGFDLLGIESVTPTSIEFSVQESGGEVAAVGRLAFTGDPPQVSEAAILAIPPNAKRLGFGVDHSMKASVIDGVIEKLREGYIFPEVAEAMAEALRRRVGEYEAVTSGVRFAEILTAQLREVSSDLHLHVSFRPFSSPRPPANSEPSFEERERYRRQMARINCGFEKAEMLPGNIGYLKFNLFADPAVCGPTATAAMNFLQHVETLIIDLRDNRGGAPAMVAYITSYLFEAPTHLNDLYNRAADATRQWWTMPHVPGERLAEQPVYVLTSKRTFSGAEEFAYNLKALNRATIVGETTGGGAHPVCDEWLNEQFSIRVPCERAINPITKTNWEKVGVMPDVAVAEAAALEKARALINIAAQSKVGQ